MTDNAPAPPDAGAPIEIRPAPVFRRKRGRGGPILAVIAVITIAGGGAAYASKRDVTTQVTVRTRTTTQVTVQRRDLVVTTSQPGTLGYGTAFAIIEGGGSTQSSASATSGGGGSAASPSGGPTAGSATTATPTSAAATGRSTTGAPAATAAPTTTTTTLPQRTSGGTLTATADSGTLLKRGDPIYRVDNIPRVLFYGSVPAYRALSAASTPGDDILGLEQNLVALGFDPDHQITVDTTYTDATIAAVARWQASLGIDQTGAVPLGQFIVLPGPSRVGNQKAQLGSAIRSASPVTEVTPIADVATTVAADGKVTEQPVSRRVVTTTIAVSDRGKLKVGDPAQIDFTDGTNTTAKVASIGEVATRPANGRGNATVDVTLTLDNDSTSSDLVTAPVTIELPNQSQAGALVVPTTALVALKEGGYGIEVVQPDGGTKLVGVKPGLYSNSFVSIVGNGITQGTRVVVSA